MEPRQSGVSLEIPTRWRTPPQMETLARQEQSINARILENEKAIKAEEEKVNEKLE